MPGKHRITRSAILRKAKPAPKARSHSKLVTILPETDEGIGVIGMRRGIISQYNRPNRSGVIRELVSEELERLWLNHVV